MNRYYFNLPIYTYSTRIVWMNENYAWSFRKFVHEIAEMNKIVNDKGANVNSKHQFV